MKRPIVPMSPSIAPAANERVGGVIGYGPAQSSHCALPHPSWPTADRSDPVVVVHGKLLQKPAFLCLAHIHPESISPTSPLWPCRYTRRLLYSLARRPSPQLWLAPLRHFLTHFPFPHPVAQANSSLHVPALLHLHCIVCIQFPSQ